MPKFRSIHRHATDAEVADRLTPPAAAAAEGGLLGVEEEPAEIDDEGAARHYLESLIAPEPAEGGLLGVEEAPSLPDLRQVEVHESRDEPTRLVFFEQMAQGVPVVGGKAVVALTPEREFVSIDAQLTEDPTVSPKPDLKPDDAISRVAAAADVTVASLGELPPPKLKYYQTDDDQWHLVYEVLHVPAAPPEFLESMREEPGHGLGASPERDFLQLTYLVDAHSGEVVVYFSESAWIDDPTDCVGMDELAVQREFFGFVNANGAFELRDPVRNIRTFDNGFGNIGTSKFAVPADTVAHNSFDFASTNTAAVSAHVNAMLVFDFFNDTLKRKGIDDAGMELVSIVNCTYQPPGDDWKNAAWHQEKMWYGQVKNAGGVFESYSRYLDVIAHELSHGVTAKTAKLQYLNESGALNESFSDIFGIAVKNLNGPHPDDASQWDWEIGSGLKNGGPLRDLSDPTRTGQPAHMTNFKKTSADSGGVHTNSGIPNKAAFNVFMAKDANGKPMFKPERVAFLYYRTLLRLSESAKFTHVPETMINVIKTLYAGRPQADIDAKANAVKEAYAAVGIV